MAVIAFYGCERPDLFAIERAAMDRPGLVIAKLRELLSDHGNLLDIGAGNGFTATQLSANQHGCVVAMEPAREMIVPQASAWVQGEAEALPFRSTVFAGAYATWAYFFPSSFDIEPGVREAERVILPGCTLAIVNNLGDDGFCALSPREIAEPTAPFEALGFELEVVETVFEFETMDDARTLLEFYFGEKGLDGARLSVGYRVGLFHKVV